MTRYQLSVEAEKLPKRFFFRAPSPYAVVSVTGGPLQGTELGRTSAIQNATHPDWTDTIFIETDSSIYMPLKISIWDDRQEMLMGEANFEATEIYQSVGHAQSKILRNGVVIHAGMDESVKGDGKGSVTLHLRGLDIKNVEPGLLGLGRSDPFFEVSKKNADHAAGVVRWNVVYRSEHIYNHLNPYWSPFTIGLEELCHCDVEWPLRISVKDWQGGGAHRLIGQFETTLKALKEHVSVRGNADRGAAFEIFVEDQAVSRGLIVVVKADIYT